MRRLGVLLAAALFCAGTRTRVGWVISTVGDPDALGTGSLPGGTLPEGPFDNRSAAELSATDGSQFTDFATVRFGFPSDAVFTHTFALGTGMLVGSAILEFGIGGLQSNDTDPETFTLGEDALRINGVPVFEAFAGVDQGGTEYDIVTVVLPDYLMESLNTGEALVSIDLNSNAGPGVSTRVEPVFYDFSRLTITEVPQNLRKYPNPQPSALF